MTPKFKTDESGHIESLEGVAVGDKFLIRVGFTGNGRKLLECSKVTEKQCVIGGKKFRIRDARELGGTDYHRCYLYSFDEHEWQTYQDKKATENAAFKLGKLDWGKVTPDKLRQVAAIVFGESQ